ncbi:MAG: TrkH family potassium uptake protein, partial [Endozoicomonas sp.]
MGISRSITSALTALREIMNHRLLFYVIGLFLTVMANFMLIPVIYGLLTGDSGIWEFLVAAGITLVVGAALILSFKPDNFNLKPRQVFVLTTLCWIVVSSFAALPFWFKLSISYTDAFFETMSGITTTGSTVLSGLDHMEQSILLWRSLLQWFGGIGFIVMAVAVLPFLKVGGMRLFQSESSDWSDKALPRSGSIAKRIILVYLVMTAVCAYLYFLGGMNGFEAINHSMSTVSTGGYSTSDASMGHFRSPFIIWTSTLFMIFASLPFVLFVRAVRGEVDCLYKDNQVQAFIGFLLCVWLVLGTWLYFHSKYSFFESLTLASFNTTSTITTTGYA